MVDDRQPRRGQSVQPAVRAPVPSRNVPVNHRREVRHPGKAQESLAVEQTPRIRGSASKRYDGLPRLTRRKMIRVITWPGHSSNNLGVIGFSLFFFLSSSSCCWFFDRVLQFPNRLLMAISQTCDTHGFSSAPLNRLLPPFIAAA